MAVGGGSLLNCNGGRSDGNAGRVLHRRIYTGLEEVREENRAMRFFLKRLYRQDFKNQDVSLAPWKKESG